MNATNICRACGGPMPPRTGRGRPPVYCTPECRTASQRAGTTIARMTKRDVAELEDAILAVVAEEHPATVRGVYYRVVSLGGIVDKTFAGYRKVQQRVLDLRREGRIPYDWIVDGTRTLSFPGAYTDLGSFLDIMRGRYFRNIWPEQHRRVYVFSEKDAISNVLSPVTNELDVPLGIVRGYASDSFAWEAAQSIAHKCDNDEPVFVYQFGDHDPSGVNAWETMTDMIRGFLTDEQNELTEFERLAVTPEQIVSMRLPTRVTKQTDTRADGFIGESVEVDAIAPTELRRIVREAIMRHVLSLIHI